MTAAHRSDIEAGAAGSHSAWPPAAGAFAFAVLLTIAVTAMLWQPSAPPSSTSSGVSAESHPNAVLKSSRATLSDAWPAKTHGPIAVGYEIANTPALSQPLEITVTATAPELFGPLWATAETTTPESLVVVSSASPNAPAGSTLRWTLTVVPVASALSYVTVTLHGFVGGTPQGRTILIPIRLADGAETAPTAEGTESPAVAAAAPEATTRATHAIHATRATQAAAAGRAPQATEPKVTIGVDGERLILLPAVETR